jgi:hypothetical protein
MAKKLTSKKAREILHDKSVHGHPLTDKQRRFFGAIAGGGWLDKYANGGKMQEYQENYNENSTSYPPGFVGMGNDTTGRNYSPAWGGQFAMGGSIPGSVGFTYARTGSIPSNGKYAKKTLPSAQDGWVKKAANAEFSCGAHPRSELRKEGVSRADRKALKQSQKEEQSALDTEYNASNLKGVIGQDMYNVLKGVSDYSNNVMNREGSAYPTYFDTITGAITPAASKFQDNIEYQVKATNRWYPGKKTVTPYDVYQGILKDYNVTTAQDINKANKLVQNALNNYFYPPVIQKRNGGLISFQDGGLQEISPVDSARKEMLSFYGSRPANLQNPELIKSLQDIRIKKKNPFLLNTFVGGAQGYYNPFFDKIGYNPNEDPNSNYGGVKSTLKHELGHDAFENLSPEMKDIVRNSINTPEEIRTNMGYPDTRKGRKYSKYIGKDTEFYTRRNIFMDALGVDPSKPISDEQAQSYVDFTNDYNSIFSNSQGVSPEDAYKQFSEKFPEKVDMLNKIQNYPDNEEVYHFMNSIKNNPETYKHVINDVTAVPGQQVPVAQNGMSFYQHGLDWKPKTISKDGSVIKDNRGQWAHPGEITEIGSNRITMQGVPYPVLGISDQGDVQMMQPEGEYKFKGKKVTEFPITKKVSGKSKGSWLDQYK